VVSGGQEDMQCTLRGVFTVTRFRNFLSRILLLQREDFDMDSMELNKRSAEHVCVCGFLWKNCLTRNS